IIGLWIVASASAINRVFVEASAERVVVRHVKTMPVTLAERRLQAVVTRQRRVGGLNDVLVERAVGIEVDIVVLPGAVSSDWTGVDVAIHQQFLSVAAGVAHGEYLVVGDFPLHAQVVIVRSRCLEVLCYREGVEWR